MSADNLFSSDEMQLVTFTLGQENFGIDIMNVQEIIRIPSITMVPQAPPYVEGVTNLRGEILPVLDTRVKFGMERTARDVSSRVIVVDVRGKKAGLSVDAVSEVLRVESGCIEATPTAVSGADAGQVSGVVRVNDGKRLVMILEAGNLCSMDAAVNNETNAVKTGNAGSKGSLEKKLEEVQLVSFLLGSEEFALEIESVREIIRYPNIVKVPNMPVYVKGVISLRDNLMPIIDMRVKLNTGHDDITDSTRVIVVDVDNASIGLVVDRVYEVTRIPKDTIFAPPQALSNENGDRLQGIARVEGGKRIIMLLEPRDIIIREELKDIGALENTEVTMVEEEEGLVNGLEEEQMVVFKLADEQYGVRITQVQEINRLSKITKVPRAPRFVEGIINLRGDVIPVIDLRKRFEIEYKNYTEFTRVIVSDINNKKVGIIVDEVLEVLRISRNLMEDAPDILSNQHLQSFMDGIANLENRMIMMLNLDNILVEKEWQKLQDLDRTGKASPSRAGKPKKTGQGREA
ncbi:MAG TPA: chemotaxis protein [Syntrophomonas sp.]|jgi:purine-binding chemotaxis protein CheW|nr:chemotaxis protein [Syntrophomonas sp.]